MDEEEGVSVANTIGSISWRIADAFGVENGVGRVKVGTRANFVGLNGGPLGFGYDIQILGDGADITLKPVHT